MCEAVVKYGDRRAEEAAKKATITANLNAVNKLMTEMKMTLEQALDFLDLDREQRKLIAMVHRIH